MKKHTKLSFSKPVYFIYRKLDNGKWKYTEAFNSTLDPLYHEHINWYRELNILWILVRTYDKQIIHSNIPNLINTNYELLRKL